MNGMLYLVLSHRRTARAHSNSYLKSIFCQGMQYNCLVFCLHAVVGVLVGILLMYCVKYIHDHTFVEMCDTIIPYGVILTLDVWEYYFQ